MPLYEYEEDEEILNIGSQPKPKPHMDLRKTMMETVKKANKEQDWRDKIYNENSPAISDSSKNTSISSAKANTQNFMNDFLNVCKKHGLESNFDFIGFVQENVFNFFRS